MGNSKSIQYCPSCDREILSDDINLSEGVALCPNCGSLHKLSQLNFSGATIEEIIANPPKKGRIKSNKDGVEISVSLFSFTSFIGSLFATLFWNGILSIFLSLAIAAVYYNFYGPVPGWFPTPGLEDGKPIMNDQVMGAGMTMFLCLFLVPFVIIGFCLFVNTLLRLFGSTKIVISKKNAYASTGISIMSFKRSFDPKKVQSIKRTLSKFNNEGQKNHVIEILSTKRTTFGLLLSEKQQEWVVTLLRQVLIHKNYEKVSHIIRRLYWL